MLHVNNGFLESFMQSNGLLNTAWDEGIFPVEGFGGDVHLYFRLYDSVMPFQTLTDWTSLTDTQKLSYLENTHPSHTPVLQYDTILWDAFGVYTGNSLYSPHTDSNGNVIGMKLRFSSFNRGIVTRNANISWFMVCKFNIQRSLKILPKYSYSRTVKIVFGTVGNAGSGADYELVNTNLVAGQEIILTDLLLTMPKTY